MESAVSGPTPFSASNVTRNSSVGAANIRSGEPPWRASRNATKFFSRCAFCRKYPDERMSSSSFVCGTSRRPATLSIPAARKLARARSTFVHEVFWVRMAPTMTSNGVSAGHQCWRPQARASLRYIVRTAASGVVAVEDFIRFLGDEAHPRGTLRRYTDCDHALHSALSVERHPRPSSHTLAQRLSALAN